MTAAYDLRQPYWDWAKTGGAIPPEQVFIQETVRITRPDGEQQWVDNPFLRYRFKSSAAITSFPKEYAAWPTTIRDPYSKDAIADIKRYLSSVVVSSVTHPHQMQPAVKGTGIPYHQHPSPLLDLNMGRVQ